VPTRRIDGCWHVLYQPQSAKAGYENLPKEDFMSVATVSLSGDVADIATDRRRRIFAIVAASSVILVEWYDFYAYAFTSIYFASAFFPSGDQTSQLLATAGIFAVGFFMRPLGGWLFGWLADKHGRKNSMVISVLMMCAGSLMIAVLPTYQTIGAAAAGAAAVGTHGAGLVGRRRIRHRRHLHERGRGQGQSRFLFVLPVRDADRRPIAGPSCRGRPAANAVAG
jgi:hypothetical protein